jgi:hypothetical protein
MNLMNVRLSISHPPLIFELLAPNCKVPQRAGSKVAQPSILTAIQRIKDSSGVKLPKNSFYPKSLGSTKPDKSHYIKPRL